MGYTCESNIKNRDDRAAIIKSQQYPKDILNTKPSFRGLQEHVYRHNEWTYLYQGICTY